jgi:hypothetical protein
MRNSSKCTECECDVLACAKNNPAPGFVATIQFMLHATGSNVFLCWRCADERYKKRQVQAC